MNDRGEEMSGLFFLFIAVILCTVIVYIRIHSKRTMLTYALIGLIVSQALWQAYIAVLYAVDILSMETAETLFRLFRIGALATPTFFFLILVETLHHAQEDMGWLNRLFTRRHAFLYGVMTIGLYGLNWTEYGVRTLMFIERGPFPHFYPISGPLGMLTLVHMMTLLVWIGCAFYMAARMKNEYLRTFHRRFAYYGLAAAVIGLFNFFEDYVIFTSLLACACFTVGILDAFHAFRDKVLERERQLAIERVKVDYVDYTTSSLVHEIRNPLTVLLGHLQLAAADERIRPNLQQTMHVVDQSARQIEHVLTDFVHYIETKKIRPMKTSLRQVIEDAMLMMGVHAQDKGVTLILEPGEPVELLMDASKMSQVFINLYKNSIEAIDAEATDKRVTTVITRQANELVVTIGDTGRGVPSHLVDALFQPFRTDKAGGMGLGLSICHSIITSHKGTLAVRDTSPLGTVIEIRLPLEDYARLFRT